VLISRLQLQGYCWTTSATKSLSPGKRLNSMYPQSRFRYVNESSRFSNGWLLRSFCVSMRKVFVAEPSYPTILLCNIDQIIFE